MKKLAYISVLFAAVLMLGSCNIRFERASKHNGPKVEKNYEIKPFQSLEVSAGVGVVFKMGDEYGMIVEGSEEEMKRFEIVQKDGVLSLSRKSDMENVIHMGSSSDELYPITVTLVAPAFSKLSLSSGGEFFMKDTLVVNNMTIDITSGGSLVMNKFQCDRFQCNLSSGGEGVIAGLKAQNITIDTSSGASFHAKLHNCGDVKASASSGSSIELDGNARSIEQDESSGASINIEDLKISK